MRPLSVVGTDEPDVSLDGLVDRLEERGTVATVSAATQQSTLHANGDGPADQSDITGTAAYTLADDGTWFATGTEASTVGDLLDELAPKFDYVLLEGFADADLPTIAVGDTDHVGPTLASAPEVSELDLDSLVDDIEGIEPHETLESLVRRVKESPESPFAGAIATFTGRVRTREDEDEPPTEYLEFEKYEAVAEEKLQAIREELTEREGVYEVLLHHRTGVIEAEEDIVFVVVLAGHRTEAFETVSDGIDRLKARVPLFKKEVTVDGEFWAHQHDRESGAE